MVVVNNTTPPSNSGNGMGFLMGVILLIIFGFLLLSYGLPALRNATSAPQINVPGEIDVNVNQ